MMKNKRRARRGFTLTETLTALAIFSLLTVAVVSGVNAAVKVYREVTAVAEAQSLTSELTQALSDELRYARNIEINSTTNKVESFESGTFGVVTAVKADENTGEVVIVTSKINNDNTYKTYKTYDLLGTKSYSSGLKVSKLELKYDEARKVFEVTITISGGALSQEKTTTLSVRVLNSQ